VIVVVVVVVVVVVAVVLISGSSSSRGGSGCGGSGSVCIRDKSSPRRLPLSDLGAPKHNHYHHYHYHYYKYHYQYHHYLHHYGSIFLKQFLSQALCSLPREPRRDWRVIVGSMNMGYVSATARNRTHNLFRLKREPIPLYHSDGHGVRFIANKNEQTDNDITTITTMTMTTITTMTTI
jgi:hypothetical protein